MTEATYMPFDEGEEAFDPNRRYVPYQPPPRPDLLALLRRWWIPLTVGGILVFNVWLGDHRAAQAAELARAEAARTAALTMVPRPRQTLNLYHCGLSHLDIVQDANKQIVSVVNRAACDDFDINEWDSSPQGR